MLATSRFFSYLVHYLFARAVWQELRGGVEGASLTVYVLAAGGAVLVALGWSRHRHRDRYRRTLRSRRWKRLRERAYRRARGRCERCHKRAFLGALQLHHKTYDRLGRERMADVELLCGDCHRSEHRIAA
jgi:hypothetical protein